MTLAAQFQTHWQAMGWADPTKRGVVAVSTGVDSMVLLALLSQLPEALRPQLSVVHINHHLRKQSETEAAFLQHWCQQHGLPLMIADWPVSAHPDHGLETAARQFRYRCFSRALKQQHADWIATAHQADEQTETILLKLLRGGQLAQLTGIAASRPFATGQLIRPLLPFSKAELYAYAQEHDITWYEDATNRALITPRNQLRQELIPQLQRVNAQAAAHLRAYGAQLARVLRVNATYLAPQLDALIVKSAPLTGSLPRLLDHSVDEQQLLLTAFIKRAAPGVAVSEARLTQLQQLLGNQQRPTGIIQLGQGWQVTKQYRTFQCWQPKKVKKKTGEHFSFMVDLNQWQPVGNGQLLGVFSVDQRAPLTAAQRIRLTPQQLPLNVRSWRSTDRLRLANGQHQTVRRALINAKVPAKHRQRAQVLVTADHKVLAVLGIKWAVWPKQKQTSETTDYHVIIKPESVKGEQHE